ncbi:hypothetical protein [Streptomyces sp. NPDC048419]|uniref:hypothetical protein n=1 Tax=Streptomyces sp. NPDC048419 TaxID=3365547 RepID=UPI003722A2B9
MNEVGALPPLHHAPPSASNSSNFLPSVVADALGYHDKPTTRLRHEISGTWDRYAA